MDELERLDRIDSAIALETETMDEALWWLSFCDTDKPEGEQFLGVCIVRSHGLATAMQEAWDKGCNPGGQVMGTGPIPLDAIDESFLNRLLTKDEALSIPEPT